jgi:hypothetical protein
VLPSKVLTDLSSGTDGAKIPAVTPEEVADAVYHVIRKQQDSVTVPNYLWALPGVYGALPKGLQRVFREALNDTQILKQLNQTARQGYTNKLQSLIKKAKAG